MRRAASMSASESVAGDTGERLSVNPNCVMRRAPRPERVEGQAVAEQQVMDGADPGDRLVPARGMDARRVAEQAGAEGLVEGGPVADPVAQAREHPLGVIGETVGGVSFGPTAGSLRAPAVDPSGTASPTA